MFWMMCFVFAFGLFVKGFQEILVSGFVDGNHAAVAGFGGFVFYLLPFAFNRVRFEQVILPTFGLGFRIDASFSVFRDDENRGFMPRRADRSARIRIRAENAALRYCDADRLACGDCIRPTYILDDGVLGSVDVS